jgi:IPT/TIG domain/PASTA domain
MRKLWMVPLLSSLILAAVVTGAQAANVVVGTEEPPTASINNGTAGDTVFNTAVAEAGATVTSPVSGEVVGWHVEGFKGGPFRLRVMTPLGSGMFLMGGTGPWVSPTGAGGQSFPVALPIKAGQTLAVDNTNASDELGYRVGGSYGYFLASPVDGATGAENAGLALEFTYYAEIQPLPTITLFGPAAGPVDGGTTVVINGTDLENATSVKFGSTPAAFTQSSEGAVTAVAPAGTAGSVPITVTTIAGTATSSQQFMYQAPTVSNPTPTPAPISTPAKTCKVPKLTGKTLKGSKTRIKGANCKVGKVTKLKGVKASTGIVVGQSKKPGTVLPAGTVVKVTLGKG